MPKSSSAPRREIVYCIVPGDLARGLHELLRGHFAENPNVEVVVEQRWRDRRRATDRRASEAAGEPPDGERRRILADSGRRVADRRAAAVPVPLTLGLPRKARAHADRLVFVRRIEPSSQHLEDIDTARLVAQIQSGDIARYTDLYMRYFDRVYAYMLVILHSQHDAEDATQHVFTAVFENIHRYERRVQPFRAWLFRIARNRALRELEQTRRLDLVDPAGDADVFEPETADMGAELPIIDWMSDRELVLFVERLPLAQRQVLVMRFMLDLSTHDIANILDRSLDDVRALQSRALRFLRDRLTAIGRAPERGARRERIGRRREQAWVLRSRRFALLRS